MNRVTDFGTLMRSERREAAARLRALLKKHDGNLSAVARALGVQYKTALRWRKTLEGAGYVVRDRERAA